MYLVTRKHRVGHTYPYYKYESVGGWHRSLRNARKEAKDLKERLGEKYTIIKEIH